MTTTWIIITKIIKKIITFLQQVIFFTIFFKSSAYLLVNCDSFNLNLLLLISLLLLILTMELDWINSRYILVLFSSSLSSINFTLIFFPPLPPFLRIFDWFFFEYIVLSNFILLKEKLSKSTVWLIKLFFFFSIIFTIFTRIWTILFTFVTFFFDYIINIFFPITKIILYFSTFIYFVKIFLNYF